ncbi:MAG: hypothetical protein AAF882_22115 [Pseudomonadota bacterium]
MREAIAGAELRFLPPQSPDLNPTESALFELQLFPANPIEIG